MSDFARANTGGATHFGDKDALTTGDADKVIVGAQFDAEFNAIVTASATKYDSSNIATQAQAEGGTSNSVLLTPLGLQFWADDDAGIVGDLQALVSPAADRLLFWDDGAGAAAFLTASTGLTITGTNITTDDSAIVLTALSGYDANQHVDHTAVSITAGLGLTGGGTIAATRDLAVGAGSGITVNANDVAITDVVAGAAQPVVITSGTFTFDLSSITEITAPTLSQSADGFLVNDAGVLKVLPIDQSGVIIVNAADAIQTFALTDANTMQVLDSASTRVWTIPANATVAFEIGTVILLQSLQSDITITAATGVTLTSEFNVIGTTATSDTVNAGGRAALIKVATNEWTIDGNLTD